MDEIEQLQTIIRDQTRMLVEKNRHLADLEYRIREMVVTGSRKEDLARLQTELHKETIEGQTSLFHALLDTVPCGIVVFNGKGIVVNTNSRALTLLEIGKEEIIGKEIDLFLPPCRDQIERGLALGEQQDPESLLLPRKEGGEVILSLQVSPILNSGGDLLGGIALIYEAPAESSGLLHGDAIPDQRVAPHVP